MRKKVKKNKSMRCAASAIPPVTSNVPPRHGGHSAAVSYASALCVFFLFAAAFFMKLNIFDRGCDIKAGEFGLFRVEEATRYRYAKLVSEGKKIPDIDTRIQYPEGLNVKKYFTTVSQRVLGHTYRIFHFKMPFHKFVIYFMFLYSSLSVIALYKAARLLSSGRLFSLAACAFYVTSFASGSRTIAGGLVEEDFALPLMFLALAFVLKSLKSRRKVYPIIVGALLAGAVSAWHVSQFFYLILTAILCFLYICRPDERKNIFNLLAPVIAILTAAGVVVPVLRGGYFLLSFSQILGYTFLLTHLTSSKLRVMAKNKAVTAAVFVILGGLIYTVSRPLLKEHAKNYAHVYTLMFNKIRYLGNKPTFEGEVKKLPFDTKVLWQSSFVSPGIQFTKDIFLIAFIFAIPGLFAGIMRLIKRKDSGVFISLALLAGFLILFMLVKRLYVFVIFFLCMIMPLGAKFLKNKKYTFAAAAFFFAGAFMQWNTTLPKLRNIPHRINSYKQSLINLMNSNLPPGSVILCNIGLAPEIVQNSAFSTVLHNHYEEKNIRDKTEEFYKSIYGTEKNLYDYAKKYSAEYMIYHWEFLFDKSANSMRYQVDAMNLFKDCAAYKLHFDENNLKYFTLIYQNEYYRLFKIHPAGETTPPAKVEYVPFFNSLVFEPQNKITYMDGMREKGPLFDDDYCRVKMDGVWGLPQLKNRADAAIGSGNYEEAEKIYLQMLEIDPYYRRTRIIISDFYMRSGLYSKAVPHISWLVANYPEPQSYYYLIESLREGGYKKEAHETAKKAGQLFPDDARFK
ncbi:hypothetical protein FP828_06565 [bacterium]|nr:hypothetical protein [bacterium]